MNHAGGNDFDPAGDLGDRLQDLDRELANLELGDIVRLKKPYGLKIDLQKGPFRFGIVAEILTTLPDGPTRNLSLYLYDPERKKLFMRQTNIPEFVDSHCSELVLYKRATDQECNSLVQ